MDRYNETIVQWLSKMQKTISLCTAEAEYYAASEMLLKSYTFAASSRTWDFLKHSTLDTPVYEDNTEWGTHVIGGRQAHRPPKAFCE